MEQRAAERQQKVGCCWEASTWEPQNNQFEMDGHFMAGQLGQPTPMWGTPHEK